MKNMTRLFAIVACLSMSACSDQNAQVDDAAPKDAPKLQPDAHPDAGVAVKRVFVTSTKTTADLKTAGAGVSGLDGASKLCNAAAGAANLGGIWNAWLSTSSKNAIDLIAGTGPWYLVDGTTFVFANKAAISSNPMSAIDLDETGATITSNAANGGVWTGTNPDGTAAIASLCGDWAVASGTTGATQVGIASASDSSWTHSMVSYGCTAATARLYCFEY